MKCLISGKETKSLTKNIAVHPEYRKDLYNVRDTYYQEQLTKCEQEIRADENSLAKEEDIPKMAKYLVKKVSVNEVLDLVKKKNKRILEMFGIEVKEDE
jgi:hypothetical protein